MKEMNESGTDGKRFLGSSGKGQTPGQEKINYTSNSNSNSQDRDRLLNQPDI
jgi:hypothetical protein